MPIHHRDFQPSPIEAAVAIAVSAGWTVTHVSPSGSCYLAREGHDKIRISDHRRYTKTRSERRRQVSVNVSRRNWREVLRAAIEADKMQSHEYRTIYDIATAGVRGRPSPLDWYRDAGTTMADPVMRGQAEAERSWYVEARPYYTIYPVAQDALGRVRLDLPADVVQLPIRSLLVRFGVGHEPECDGRKLRCVFAASLTVRGNQPGLGVWCDFGERRPAAGIPECPIYSYLAISLAAGASVEERMEQLDRREYDSESTAVQEALRYVIAVSLLGEDSELVEPDVLSKDRLRWEDTGDLAIVERAVRRGKRGWLIGSHVDVAPHMRRPHVGLRWTGEGRRLPRIVPISGSIVRRKRISEVPEGYLDYRCPGCGAPCKPSESGGLCGRCERIKDRTGANANPLLPDTPCSGYGVDRHRSGIGRGKAMGG